MPPARAITVCPLGSGSKGNCLYVGTPEGALLIDVGFSLKEILRRLALAGLDPASIRAILITHEHGDHVRGVGVVARKLRVPVYLTLGTWDAIRRPPLPEVIPFRAGEAFSAGPFAVASVGLPHDAAEPVAYKVSWGGRAIGCVTDLGHPDPQVIAHFEGCDFLVSEANHDEQMLMDGPYPWSVKRRIRGRWGHLSNQQGLALLEGMLHPGLEGVVLAHLSETCNRPELAWGLFSARLRSLGMGDIPLWTARQDEPLTGIRLTPL